MNKNSKRAYNFNAGPAALPLVVLEKAQAELLDFNGTGMSVMELSHRGKDYEAVHNRAIELLRELMAIPQDYEVLFLQGGASLQFSMVPMNFLAAGKKAGYVMTGSWSEKAYAEAAKLGEVFVAATAKEGNYRRIPAWEEISYGADSAYLHITSNNTIFGTEWQAFPDTGAVPLVADMSSDILSKPFAVKKFALIYAGAQKNLGPSGVTVVIIRRDFLEQANKNLPTMLCYATHAKNNSMYNTPPTFGIYMMKLMLEWVKAEGGVPAIYKRNREKAALIYDAIDASNGFYVGHAQPEARSLMNITFRLAEEELEKKFLDQAKKTGFVGLNGHRSVGGCRASSYNAVPYESCQALRDFMLAFQKENA
ncbi:3-phosphoserine/phosphohydroxythreonine transaminase [Sporomusa acidovorans]|uniref:Phosphoserine aminotransferase n=1 Tax=Sporomusa acidovorans (strain ATCC 49682 / DSM 3132 / Mol) TaxID=1123286 RepID=A0ABZ3JAX8_SPOA4|nr:3-phosphoserine/phosphohydroxythreonine transaminase [Sporomusa acidovorans]OZC21669.1 phosphoserine aminotransferase [Sporomusa acidovorans DSM 3132]SDD60581.1 phosphoserine aminotransferase apoenzyme [Sporomusa acidovorans]